MIKKVEYQKINDLDIDKVNEYYYHINLITDSNIYTEELYSEYEKYQEEQMKILNKYGKVTMGISSNNKNVIIIKDL